MNAKANQISRLCLCLLAFSLQPSAFSQGSLKLTVQVNGTKYNQTIALSPSTVLAVGTSGTNLEVLNLGAGLTVSGSSIVAKASNSMTFLTGPNDYYINLTGTGSPFVSGSLNNFFSGDNIPQVSTWSPPKETGTFYPAIPASITGTCYTRFDAALQQIPAGTSVNPVVIHLGAGVFYTAGISAHGPWTNNLAGISGTNYAIWNLNALYSQPEVKDWWIMKGEPGATTIRLLPGITGTVSSTLVSGTYVVPQDWQVLGPGYDTNPLPSEIWGAGPPGPDANHYFDCEDIIFDGNIQNEGASEINAGITSVCAIYRRIGVVNMGNELDTGEMVELFVRSLYGLGTSYAMFDHCWVSGTAFGLTPPDALCGTTEGDNGSGVRFNADTIGCSVTYTGTQSIALAYGISTGSNSYVRYINNYEDGASYGINADTGIFDNQQVLGNTFLNSGYAILYNGGASSKNLLIANNFIRVPTAGVAFQMNGNGSPQTGRITGNTVVDGGRGGSYVLSAASLYSGTAGKLQVDNNWISPTLGVSGSGWVGFWNMASSGTGFSALNNTVFPGGM